MAIFSLKYSSTADSRPDPASLVAGEIAININTQGYGVFYADCAGGLLKVGSAEVSSTAPNSSPAGYAGNSIGEFWMDTTTNTLRVWSGTEWLNSEPNALPGRLGVVYGCTTSCSSFFGCGAGIGVTSGTCNTAIGAASMSIGANTGGCNTAIGAASLCSVTGTKNVALGYGSGTIITSGSQNVVIGPNVEPLSATGSCQLAIGFMSGQNWLTGDSDKNIRPGAGIQDCAGGLGTAGQVLSSTGTGVSWITPSSGTGTVSSVTAGTGLSGGTITTSGTISLADTAVTPGSYTYASLTVDQQGRLTSASDGAAPIPCSLLTAKGDVIVASSSSTPTALSVGTDGYVLTADSTCTAGVKWAAGGGGGAGVTSVDTGVGLTGGPITSTGTISLDNTVVTPGSYTYASLVVDAQGRLTSASSGDAPNTSVTAPITNSGTSAAPVIGIDAATTSQLGVVQVGTNLQVSSGVVSVNDASTAQRGVVQLNNTATSTAIDQALTAAQGKALQDQINALVISGGLVLIGTFDSSTGTLITVTPNGALAGFTVGSNLPSPAPANAGYFVTVGVGGSYSPPGGGGPYDTIAGDWLLSSGSSWDYLNVGRNSPSASTTTPGVVELATVAETQAGTSGSLAITPEGAAGTYISCAIITAKGDILAGTAASTPSVLSVGADGCVLSACSACASGLAWISSGATAATPQVIGLVYGCTSSVAAKPTALGYNAGVSDTTGLNNTYVGEKAGYSNASGCSNVYIGTCAGYTASSACNNTVVGARAGSLNMRCDSNTLVGSYSGYCLFTGAGNVMLGYAAGCSVTAGSGNVLLGNNAACAAVDLGSFNIAIGSLALCGAGSNSLNNIGIGQCTLTRLTTSSSNVAVGNLAGRAITTGGSNIALGGGTLGNCLCSITGCYNVAIGTGSLAALDGAATGNVGLGVNAGRTTTSGCYNVLIGYDTVAASPTGSCQLAIGYASGCRWIAGSSDLSICLGGALKDDGGSAGTAGQFLLSTGSRIRWCTVPIYTLLNNAGLGLNALKSITTGTLNSALGASAGCNITTGQDNITLGYLAGAGITTASANIAIGRDSMVAVNTAGQDNVAIGRCTLACTTASNNVSIGYASGKGITTGICNVGIGPYSLTTGPTTGNCNMAIGNSALCSVTTGNANVGIGPISGCNITTGSCNVVIGSVNVASPTGNCQLAIGTNGACWLTGDDTLAIRPAAGITDCAGSTGTAGQVLMSNGLNAVCWGAVCAVQPSAYTAKGTILAASAASTPTALAVGTDGLVLTADSTCATGLKWAAAGGGGGGSPATPTVAGTVYGSTVSTSCYAALGYATAPSMGTWGVAIGHCVFGGASISSYGNTLIGSGLALCSSATAASLTLSTIIGALSGYNCVSGTGHTVVGAQAGQYMMGGCNTIIGYQAAAYMADDRNVYNIAIGPSALMGAVGLPATCTPFNHMIAIGLGAFTGVCYGTNSIVIGHNTVNGTAVPLIAYPATVTNRIFMGNSLHTCAQIKVAWTTTSDVRDKAIDPAGVPHGLSFVEKINPIAFRFCDRCTQEITDDKLRYGFSAQELAALEADNPVLVSVDDPDKLQFTDAFLNPVLVNAIKELSAEVKQLRCEIDILKGG